MIEGSCHCGAVTFAVAHAPETVTSCNCSLCRRTGTLMAPYAADQVRIDAPEGATRAYIQGDRTLANHHCVTCGCLCYWLGLGEYADRVSVNARLLPPEILSQARVRRFDGADSWTFLDP